MKNWVLLDNLTKIQSQPISTDELESAILRLPKSELGRYFLWTSGWKNWQPLQEYLESDQKTLSVAIQMNTQTAQVAINNLQKQTTITQSTNPSRQNNKNEVFVLKDNTMTQTIAAHSHTESTQHTKTMAVDNITHATLSNELKIEPVKPAVLQNDYTSDQIKSSSSGLKNINFKDLNTPYRNRSERHEFKIEVLLINKKNKTFRSYSKNISLSGTLLEDNIPSDFYEDSFDLVVVNRQPTNALNSRVQVKAVVIKNEGYSQRITFLNVTPVQKQRLKDLLNDYITQQKKKRTA